MTFDRYYTFFEIVDNNPETLYIIQSKINCMSFLRLFIFAALFSVLYFDDAYAYLDPGSGSMVIQMVIGALVGVGITVKIYWYKLKDKLFSIKSKK